VSHDVYNTRVTLVAKDARIVKVFYPVFPEANAGEILRWLQNR
jgi:hypothetical protein